MLLDFSNEFEFPQSTGGIWQKEILNFLNDWFSDKDFILSKTSGSTGGPKEIRIPKSAMKMSAAMTGEFFNLKEGNSALLCMPVNFIAGKMMIVRAIELKLKLYCIQPKSEINLSEFPALDFVPMTPMQVENSFENLSKIKILLIGGAPVSDELRRKLSKLQIRIFESYGMTETITHIALKEISDEWFSVLNKVKIQKDNRGCLVIKTPYLEEEIVTNDLVEIKNEIQFKWLGRFDNVINSGGIKFSPEQIEAKIKSIIPKEFIISSLPDNKLGQKLILIIEGNPSFDFSHNELVEVLDKYEIPKETYFLEKFPRTESGKIQRQKVLELIK